MHIRMRQMPHQTEYTSEGSNNKWLKKGIKENSKDESVNMSESQFSSPHSTPPHPQMASQEPGQI